MLVNPISSQFRFPFISTPKKTVTTCRPRVTQRATKLVRRNSPIGRLATINIEAMPMIANRPCLRNVLPALAVSLKLSTAEALATIAKPNSTVRIVRPRSR